MDDHPPPNYVNPETRQPELLGVQISMTALAVLLVGLRLYTRKVIKGGFGPDDWTILAATVLAVIMTICSCLGVLGGMGLHQWDIPPDTDTRAAGRISFVTQILYMPTLQLTKVSILLFFLSLRPGGRYSKVIYGVMAICIGLCISVTFADLFQCKPLGKAWYGDTPGKCIDQLLFFRSTAIINIVLDFVLLFLPMPLLWRVQRPLRQRIALVLIFCVGIFVCAASIVRLTFWYKPNQLRSSPDPSWNRVDMSNWSCIEYCVGIICASLPHLKALIVRIIPSFFGTVDKSSDPYPSYSHQRTKSRCQSWRNNSRQLRSDAHMGQGITVTTTIMNTDQPRGAGESQEYIIEMGRFESKDRDKDSTISQP
ncbi:hypothetical protein VTO42DRAFT_7692 [Malbranchea cinnamomea]